MKVKTASKVSPDQTFEGTLSKDNKKIVGVMGSPASVSAAYMAPTDMDKLTPQDLNAKFQAKPDELKLWAETAAKLVPPRPPTSSAANPSDASSRASACMFSFK